MDEQRYKWVREAVFVNRWGRQRPTIYWLTNCPDCGIEFEVFTDDKFTKPVRRCPQCKRGGVRTMMKAVPMWPEGGGGRDGGGAGANKPEGASAKNCPESGHIQASATAPEPEQNQ